ncbi:DUF748 domain-containing protein [Candidatus Methylocalor cossyra]|uniref:DUF748 domain-containing protein n=1 Tax=Candidatus Methylocalor cossyra TaxID=3108543 RepID=A0ABM9NHE2_9GAMM
MGRRLRAGVAGVGIVLLLAGLYGVAGHYLVPYLIRAWTLPWLSARLGARVAVQGVAFDPLRWRLSVQGLSLGAHTGAEFLRLGELSVVADGPESLRHGKLVVALHLHALHLRWGREARASVGSLVGVRSGGGMPVRFREIRLDGGRLEWRDAGHGHPLALVFDAVAATVVDLDGAGGAAPFRLTARVGTGGSLVIQGLVSPLAVEGQLEAQRCDLAAWAHELLPASPWRVRAGTFTVRAAYRWPLGTPTGFAIHSGEVAFDGVELRDPDDRPYRIATLRGVGLAYREADRQLRLDRLELHGISAGGGSLAALSASELSLAIPLGRLGLRSATGRDLAAPWGRADFWAVEGVSYAAGEQRLSIASATLRALRVAGSAAGFTLGSVRATDARIALRQRSLAIATLVSEQGELHLSRTPDGTWRIPGLPLSPGTAPDSGPWAITVGELRLNGYALDFFDQALLPPVPLRFAPVAFRVADFTSEPGRRFTFWLEAAVGEEGRIEVDGQAQLMPLQAELRFGVDKLALGPLQPYWAPASGFRLASGRLNLWGDLTLGWDSALELAYSGAADIVDLVAVDKREGKDLLRCRSLKLDGLVYGTRPRRLGVRMVTAEQPYGRVFITADGELNLARDGVVSGTARGTKPPAPWPLVIGAVRIVDGRLDFGDWTLKPPFSADIRGVNGTIRGLSFRDQARADVFLEGRVNRGAPVRIYGRWNPADFRDYTDLALEFRGVNLSSLSPYAGKFAGYRIEKGKLDLDLRYRLRHRELTADSRIVLDQLTLGERVESPSATSLPVDLAVALLKDGDGRIDLELPISGRLDDPEFSLGRLYADALAGLFTKLVGSPFAALSSLLADGGEDLGAVRFQPGEAALADQEKRRLSKIAALLRQRPGLTLDIKASADPVADGRALAAHRAAAAGPALGEPWAVAEAELRALAQARAEAIRDYLVLEEGVPDRRIYIREVTLIRAERPAAEASLSLSGS